MQGEDQLKEKIEQLGETLQHILDIMNDSTGVAGWHLNGDIATWDELGLPEKIVIALRKAFEVAE